MRDEFIPFFLPNLLLEVVEKSETLFVRDGRKGVIWILAFEVGDQLREFMVWAEIFDRV